MCKFKEITQSYYIISMRTRARLTSPRKPRETILMVLSIGTINQNNTEQYRTITDTVTSSVLYIIGVSLDVTGQRQKFNHTYTQNTTHSRAHGQAVRLLSPWSLVHIHSFISCTTSILDECGKRIGETTFLLCSRRDNCKVRGRSHSTPVSSVLLLLLFRFIMAVTCV